MTPDEAIERAAAHAVRLFNRTINTSRAWDEKRESSKQAWRGDIMEILDASGYPQALSDAATLIRKLSVRCAIYDSEDRDLLAKAVAWVSEHDPEAT